MNKYPYLFQPIKIRNVTYRNRIFSAPCAMTYSGHKHSPDLMQMLYFEEKARGGAAAVTISETSVNLKYATRKPNLGNVAILPWDQNGPSEWTKEAFLIRRHGAVPSVQLHHAGATTMPKFIGGRDPIGPDDFIRKDGVHVTGMDEALMQECCEDFAKAAKFMKGCGFKMLMLHGGHGWLLAQFLSPLTNHRTDEYGGSIENRARFPLRICKAVREAVGEDFVIEFRISGDEHTEGGISVDDVCRFAQMAEEYVDIIHISAGSYYSSNTYTFPGIFVERGCNLAIAKQVKKAVKKAKVSVVGGFADPAEMDRIIKDGDADIVYMARQLIADPQTPNKWRRGQEDDVVPCTRCMNCLGRFDKFELGCDVNPHTGHEIINLNTFAAPLVSRKVLVIGGGPGGMTAAITARNRGHKVVLLEKEGVLGGTMNYVEHDCHKGDLMKFRDYLIRKVYEKGVDVRLNTEATVELIESLAPDNVICAVGAEPLVPPIPGLAENALTPKQLWTYDGEVGDRVILIGGGLTGAETGLSYAELGHHVTVIEMTDKVAVQANHMQRPAMMETMQRLKDNITCLTNTKCLSVSKGSVEVQGPDGKVYNIEGDLIINALGLKPRAALVEELRKADVQIFEAIGDCDELGQVRGAVQAGYFRALDIL